LPTSPGKVATLDDAQSFRIRVTAATVALTGTDLGALLNTVVFAYPDAPLRQLQVRTQGTQLVQTGIMHKGVDLRFRLVGTPTLTSGGAVRIHPSEVRVLGMNGEKVLHLLGLHLADLLDLKGAHGVSVSGDDLILDATAILPPPAIEGRLAAIRTEGNALVQEFVPSPDDSVFGDLPGSDSTAPGFIHFRGSELRFGRLLMSNTDLRIVGAQRGAPFDLSLPHYARQLTAGESHTLANGALVVYMPNFSSLAQAPDSTTRRRQ
jgi:hypothetical protein